MNRTAWRIGVVGAGPVGLALALLGARLLPEAQFTVIDARPADRDVAGDPRTLALAAGSVMLLERLRCWEPQHAAPITSVHVSQAPPSPGAPEVLIDAAALGVAQLGAVLPYGALVAPLQRAWQAAVQAEPARLAMRFGRAVQSIEPVGVEVKVRLHGEVPVGEEKGSAPNQAASSSPSSPSLRVPPAPRAPGGGDELPPFDLVVVAEGGVFAEQARKALRHDYAQTAWVGTLALEGGVAGRAYERFTRQGPLALLPLPPAPNSSGPVALARQRAALVWCVASADDPVQGLSAAQRLVVLNSLAPPGAGRVVELSPLKAFPLGLNAERTLVAGRQVRIGNAAQTLHPVAGQGLNLGLRDAHGLVTALRHSSDLERALSQVEWARAPDRWSMIAATDFLARSFTWQWPGVATLRAAGLGAIEAMPLLKTALAMRMMFGAR